MIIRSYETQKFLKFYSSHKDFAECIISNVRNFELQHPISETPLFYGFEEDGDTLNGFIVRSCDGIYVLSICNSSDNFGWRDVDSFDSLTSTEKFLDHVDENGTIEEYI